MRLGRDSYPTIPEIHGEFVIGRATVLQEGNDVTLITTGIMVWEGLQAAQELARGGLSVGVLHMPTLKPLDTVAVLAAARRSGAIVTAEEHSICGGLGEAVASALAEEYPVPLRRVGMADVFGESGRADELLDKYGLRARDIVCAAKRVLEAKRAS